MTSRIVVPPGETIGVLGGGQLGRMFALAAARLGYKVWALVPETDAPIESVCARTIHAEYTDQKALAELAQKCSVVTVEFENVPASALTFLEDKTLVRPGPKVLHICQNRLREKNFLRDHKVPVVPFMELTGAPDMAAFGSAIGYPCVVKTAGFGYDGKGQRLVRSHEELACVLKEFKGQPLVTERFIDFAMEISVIGARTEDGEFAAFGPIANEHKNHILDVSQVPAPLAAKLGEEARAVTRNIMALLDAIGLLCVEFFVSKSGELYVNELAPRPHNSGHYTLDVGRTSQFEQHVRAITGLPLGQTDVTVGVAMANLLGDLWQDGPPDWPAALTVPGIHLHLYGKKEPRPGRKMGHLTAVAKDAATARSNVLSAWQKLTKNPVVTNQSKHLNESNERFA